MKIAIIADIHGNLVGLDAVLADLDGEQPDHLICLGDLAAGGPQPAEAVERVRALGCPVIMGNGDAWMAEWAEPGQPPEQSPDRQLLDIARWCHEQLSADDLRYLATLDASYHLALGQQMSMLCFHGSPQSYYDVITATTSDEELERMLGPVTTTILIGGHTHVQMLRRYKEAVVINPGSAGLPHGRVRSKTPIRIPPCAEYAVISVDRGSLRTDLRRVPISLDALRRSALESGMPHAAWWAQRWGP